MVEHEEGGEVVDLGPADWPPHHETSPLPLLVRSHHLSHAARGQGLSGTTAASSRHHEARHAQQPQLTSCRRQNRSEPDACRWPAYDKYYLRTNPGFSVLDAKARAAERRRFQGDDQSTRPNAAARRGWKEQAVLPCMRSRARHTSHNGLSPAQTQLQAPHRRAHR